jgi:SAM-dependent methyltransferase
LTQQETYSDSARVAYDAFAPKYDEFNSQNDYEVWLGEVLLPELEKHGLKTGRVLDVGCGTGRAFDALLRRGWEVWGCDLSPEMLLRAGDKNLSRPPAERIAYLFWGNACQLPDLKRPFDLILALNDVVNYLTEDGDLERCFSGVARNLAPGGLVCFDTNSLGLMRENFAGGGMDRGDWKWRGRVDWVEPGGTYEAIVSGPGIKDNVHRQRHWTEEQVRGALEASGLTCLARRGHYEDPESWEITLQETADEERDLKAIYIAGHHGEG